MIPFLSFDYQNSLYREKLIESFTKVLDSNWYILGRELSTFEENYARLHGMKYSLGVANGLDALKISLTILGIREGDEVIVPSNTYIATWLAVSSIGAIPIPVEPNELTFNINPDLIESKITTKTKALIPVHLYGQPCEMTRIMEIAKKHNLFVIEDNAQSHLAKWEDKITGSFGEINATSFYPGKNLGALGDGGGITTNSEDLYLKARAFRNYGSEKKYINEIKGINSRLDELQASMLNIKLQFLQDITLKRQYIARKYDSLLEKCNNIKTPFTAKKATHVYHLYVIMCERRDELKEYLESKGISTLIHYPIPPHLQNAYSDLNYKVGDFPIAENMAKSCLSLPNYPGLLDYQIQYISEEIINFYKLI